MPCGTPLIPGSIPQSKGEDLFNLLLQAAVILNPALAFPGLRFGQSPSGALALHKAGPAIVDAVQSGRLGLAGAVDFATGAPGGR